MIIMCNNNVNENDINDNINDNIINDNNEYY